MKMRILSNSALVSGAILLGVASASAESFKWASNTDPQTMDPHAVN
jgi:peptide/nickel transport system substrate-binding protein